MLTTNVLPWLRSRRVVALIVALALVLSLAFALVGNSWTVNASPDEVTDQVGTELVAEDELIIAGPSWTWSRSIAPPPIYFGPSWG